MQSTKDESGWGHRIGGGFVRLHHSVYQKKRLFQNGFDNEDNIEDLPGSLSFASRKSSFGRSMAGNLDNVGYNMQFLRHNENPMARTKWEYNQDWDDEDGALSNIPNLAHDDVKSSPVSSLWMEKLLVVLLVASATVCFLTNLLVLIILTKRRKRKSISSAIKSGAQNTGLNDSSTRWNPANTFRYQIVTSHCFAGIVASTVVIYPLKILSLVLSRSDRAFHHHRVAGSQLRHYPDQVAERTIDETVTQFGFLTSQNICIILCSSPLVAFVFLSLLHNLMLTFEQCLKKISLSHYMVLVSSQGYTRIMVGSLWILTFCFTILPTILDPNMTKKWKHYDSSSKYYKHHVLQKLQSEEKHKFQDAQHSERTQSFCYLKEYWSFEYWLLITVGSGVISSAFVALCITSRMASEHSKETQSTCCTKEKTSLYKARPKNKSSRCEQEFADLLTSDCSRKINESQSKTVGPRRNRLAMIKGTHPNVISNYPYHKRNHRRLQIKCHSARNFGVKQKPTRRLRKWSSWPVVSYPGLAELNECVKRQDGHHKHPPLKLSDTTNSSKSEMYVQDDDTIPIMDRVQRKTSTMVVKNIPPTPLDVSTLLSCKINYIVVFVLLIPSLMYSRPSFSTSNSIYLQEMLYRPTGRISQITQKDIVTMAWTYFLVAIAGAFTPVLHLLCDDWISTLGLETLRSFHLNPHLDRFYRTKAFFGVLLEKFRKCDPIYTSNTALQETQASAKETQCEYIFVPNKKQRTPLEPEDLFDEFENKLSRKTKFGRLNDHLRDKKDILSSVAKTSDAAKKSFSPIREIEENIDIKNSSSSGTKNPTYDDLMELKDDLHYL